jgi:stage II sporulation protein D
MPSARSAAHHAPAVVAVFVTMVLLGGFGFAPALATVRADGASATTSLGAQVTSVGASITFFGRGYGHGVGMNQYGARGRAIDGQSAADILAHYYASTTQGTVALTTPIRVRVLRNFAATASRPLVLYPRRTDWRIDGIDTVFPKDARVEVRPTVVATATGSTVRWRIRIVAPSGALLRDARTSSFRIRGLTSSAITEVASKHVTKDTYRGVMRVVLSSTSTRASVVNELSLERYLRGVVPAEMPASWPAEALKAQAIAARSYAARRLRPGVASYDVGDDASGQVYLGSQAERAATTSAIGATAGIVLRSGTAIANTLFHSTGGGATEDNENVFVAASGAKIAGPVSYLRGSLDRRADGTAYDGAAPYATWKTATYSIAQLSAWFAADARTRVGTLTALGLTNRGVSGRLISVTLIGTSGNRTVSGNVFRSIFNAARPAGDPMLRSTLFDVAPIP